MTAGRHVLLVDDDPETPIVLRQLFEYYFDCKAGIADSASAAREYLRLHHVDVIVSDFHMPGENGLLLAKGLRHDGFRIPFFLYTAASLRTVDLRQEDEELPYFQKPDFKGLLSAVAQKMQWAAPL